MGRMEVWNYGGVELVAGTAQGKQHALLFAIPLSAGLNVDFSSWATWIRATPYGR